MSGGLAALSAAMIWAGTSSFFARAGRATSPAAVNAFKTTAGALIFTLALVLGGHLPLEGMTRADGARLVLSGLVGLTLGDSLLFRSFVELGARRASLVYSSYPVMGAIGGAIFLGEHLGGRAILGMTLALGGIAWVILERPEGSVATASAEGSVVDRAMNHIRHHLSVGVLAGLGAALGSASGALIAKPALGHLDTTPATWVRMSGGAAGLLVAGAATGRLAAWGRAIVTREWAPRMIAASIAGPFAGVWCMFYALRTTESGVALTLLATTPVWLLAYNAVGRRERVSPREIVGVLLAMAGIAVLMTRGR